MHSTILEVRNLKKYFPVNKGWFATGKEYLRAVDGIDFYIKEGETLGLVGESGCGKSTAGRTILKLLEPTEGQIIFEGKNITHFDRRKLRTIHRAIQLIFQDPFASLNPRKTVGDTLDEVLLIHGMKSSKERSERVKKLMQMVGLKKEHIFRYPHEFSGGQRQRIVIARTLAVNPKFIICDEPVSALDVSIQAQIINLLLELRSQFRLTYMFISHDLRVVKHISDRIAVMYLGKIVEIAPTEDLFKNPAHPYSKALLSAIPILDPGKKRKKFLLKGEVPSPINPPKGCRFHTRCNYAFKKCRLEEPKKKCIGGEHYVACHLY